MAFVSISITRNDIGPAIKKLEKLGHDTTPVMRSIGNAFLSITKGDFNPVGAKLRPAPWKAKRDGTPSNLQKSTTLSKAFQLTVTAKTATLTNATKYAAIHQFGGVIKPSSKPALRFQSGGHWWSAKQVTIPARPFYPVLNGKLTPEAERRIANAGTRAVNRLLNGGVAV